MGEPLHSPLHWRGVTWLEYGPHVARTLADRVATRAAMRDEAGQLSLLDTRTLTLRLRSSVPMSSFTIETAARAAVERVCEDFDEASFRPDPDNTIWGEACASVEATLTDALLDLLAEVTETVEVVFDAEGWAVVEAAFAAGNDPLDALAEAVRSPKVRRAGEVGHG